MGKDKGKNPLEAEEEHMAAVQKRLESMQDLINNLPTPEPIPSDQRSAIDFSRLAKSPLNYSPEFLERIAKLDPPQEIDGSGKEAMARLIELIQHPFTPDEETLKMIEEMRASDETEED